MTTSLDIIIINWNAGRQLRTCLESIVTAKQGNFMINRVVVVDNASSDGSIDKLNDLALPLNIICNTENRGFGVASNQGAKESKADYLLFLNPDTRLYNDSLTIPIQFMQNPHHKKIGICGIQLIDENGHVSRTCARFPRISSLFSKIMGFDRMFPKTFPSHFMTEWDHTSNMEIEHVIGAFFMVRRPLFESLDGFDERFFVYLEDIDFSFRAKQADWRSFYLAESKAYHKGGGVSEQIKAHRLFYSLRSRILYGYKHFSYGSATALLLATLILEPISRGSFFILKGSIKDVKDTLLGFMYLWMNLPRILRRTK